MYKKFFLLMLLLFPLTSEADDFSGMQLLEVATDPYNKASFDWYVAGYIEGHQNASVLLISDWLVKNNNIARKLAKEPKPIICPDNGVTYGQMSLIVKKYLQDNPKKLNKMASVLIEEALVDSFPCKAN